MALLLMHRTYHFCSEYFRRVLKNSDTGHTELELRSELLRLLAVHISIVEHTFMSSKPIRALKEGV